MKLRTSSGRKFIIPFVLGLLVAQTVSAQFPPPVVPPPIQIPGPAQQLLAKLDPVLQRRAPAPGRPARVHGRGGNAATVAPLGPLISLLGRAIRPALCLLTIHARVEP